MPNRCINDILQKLSLGNVGVFWGAGMSRKAGIPTVVEIKARIIEEFNLSMYKGRILEFPFPFESFMEILSQYTSIDNFLSIYRIGQPTEFYHVLKILVKSGFVKQLMTTNFDILFEKTYELDSPPTYKLSYKETQFGDLVSDQVNYIKIHGCIHHENKLERSIRTVMNSVVQCRLRKLRRHALEFMFKEAGLRTIIVLGYSCSDIMDITRYVRNIHGSETEIIYIQHSDNQRMEIRPFSSEDMFYGFKGYKCICNTDTLIDEIISYFKFDIKMQVSSTKPSLQKFFRFDSLSKAEKILAMSHVLFRNAEYSLASSIIDAELSIVNDNLVKANMYVMLFELYHNRTETGQYDRNELIARIPEMQQWMTFSAHVYRKTTIKKRDRWNKLGQLYNHWGHILLSARDYSASIKAYKEAKMYFKKSRNHFRLWQIRNNYANVYFIDYLERKQETKSIPPRRYKHIYELWRGCYRYYKNSGYLYEYAISCQNMADLLYEFEPTKHKRIQRYLIQAREVYKYLNDVRGIDECNQMMERIYKKISTLST